MPKALDLSNKRFDRLVVIEKSHVDKWGCVYWICKCDCGNSKTVRATSLVQKTTKSCGCYSKERSTRKDGLAGCSLLHYKYKYAAEKRNLEFKLTLEEFKIITSKNCHYCGLPPIQKLQTRGYKEPYFYNGIDRKDNEIGYILKNCVACCLGCNFIKGKRTYNDMMEISKMRLEYYRKILK